jgi:glycosyltransferase involved in cell wall biosynthesis
MTYANACASAASSWGGHGHLDAQKDRMDASKDLRVLHFFKTSLPDTFGGVERVIDTLATGCRPHGVESEVLSLSRDRQPRVTHDLGYRLTRAHQDFEVASTGFSLSGARMFADRVRAVDLVHYHFPWPYMDALHFLLRVNKPSVVTYHADILRRTVMYRLYKPLMSRFLGSVDKIVATSAVYAETSEVLSHYREKTVVIPLGIAAAQQPDAADHARWDARLPPRFFLFIGVLRHYKGLQTLLAAARQTRLPLFILGDGPLMGDMQEAVRSLDNVVLLGRLGERDKQVLLERCLALVLPSHDRSEAFGVALLEAQMAARPAISCEVGSGTSYVNVDGVTGLVVPPKDGASLAQAMDRLWQDPLMAHAMGQAGHERRARLFQADRMARQYSRLYRSAVGNG